MPEMMPPPPPPPPRPRPYVLRVPIVYVNNQNCRPVYHNQRTIDGLNAILAGCDDLVYSNSIKCDRSFIRRVERELDRQLAMGVYIGTSCANPTLY